MTEILAAQRFAALAVMAGLFVATCAGLRSGAWREEPPPRLRQMRWRGMAILSGSLSVHLAYWWLWQMAVVSRRADVQDAIESWSGWVVIPVMIVVTIGAAKLLAGYTAPLWGRWWRVASLGLAVGLAAIGYVVAVGARP